MLFLHILVVRGTESNAVLLILFSAINPPKRPSPSEIDSRELSMAISHEGYGSGSVEMHPRAYHNLIKVSSQYTHVSSRKSAVEIWVGDKMEPRDMLLLFARHGIEHPPTK